MPDVKALLAHKKSAAWLEFCPLRAATLKPTGAYSPRKGGPTPASKSACHIIAEALEITGFPRCCSSTSSVGNVGMPLLLLRNTAVGTGIEIV